MATFLALSPKDCEGKGWLVPHDLSHLQAHVLIPLHAGELAKAAASMPLAVVKQGAEWQLVGVCGLAEQRNLFINNGQWVGHYRPDWLSIYPFRIMSVGDKGFVVADTTSGLVVEGGGEPFFDESGQLSAAVAERVEMLKAKRGLQATTSKALEALHQAGVLTPWPENLKSSLGMAIDGLHMLDERALAQLDDEAFLKLRQAQALPVAYALNFSIHQAHLLLRLAKLHGRDAWSLRFPMAVSWIWNS